MSLNESRRLKVESRIPDSKRGTESDICSDLLWTKTRELHCLALNSHQIADLSFYFCGDDDGGDGFILACENLEGNARRIIPRLRFFFLNGDQLAGFNSPPTPGSVHNGSAN